MIFNVNVKGLVEELLALSALQKVQVIKYEDKTVLQLTLNTAKEDICIPLAQSFEEAVSIIESIRKDYSHYEQARSIIVFQEC